MEEPSHPHGVQHRGPTTVVAMDIGTHGSGFAYRLGLASAIKQHTSYPNQPRPYPKMRSAILYKHRTVKSIGWTALEDYGAVTSTAGMADCQLEPNCTAASSPYCLVTDCKLLLHPDPGNEEYIAKKLAELPHAISPVQVMADFLTMFKRYILKQLRLEAGGNVHLVSANNITWVVTVPALWSDKSKSDMRESCFKAGFFRGEKPEMLVLAVEPEAAALWVRHQNIIPLPVGQIFMVLDAGGGTVDWTVHQCIERGGQTVLAEAAVSKGALLGSIMLDLAFLQHYKEQVGAKAFDDWKDSHPNELLEVLKQWERLKCLWPVDAAAGPDTASHIDHDDFVGQSSMRVCIPAGLRGLMTSEDLNALQVLYYTSESISLSNDIMMKLFDPVIDKILHITNSQLRQVVANGAAGMVDKVLLVGGFSASPYFQERVSRGLTNGAAGAAPEVVVMPQPYAAVLQGAVVYGCHPELINARKSRRTYGVKTCGPYVEGAPDRFWHDDEKCFFTGALLSTFVEQGQLVEAEETVELYFAPVHSRQTSCCIEIFEIDGKGASFVDEEDTRTKKLAYLIVELEGTPGEQEICVTFQFGRAEVIATAVEEPSGRPRDTRFKFAFV